MKGKDQSKKSISYINSKQIYTKIRVSKKFVRKAFAKKICLIKKLMDFQVSLTDMYFRQILVKEKLRLRYDENTVVTNALLKQIYLSYSIMLLLENTFYGSARVLLRQFFEFLIIGKFSEFDSSNIIQKWESKMEESGREHDINLSQDIFNKIKMKKNISELQKMWKILSDYSHPTKFAQQVPHFSTSDDHFTWITENYGDIHYTFDLFFTLICMNYHLLNSNWGRKAKGWDFGHYRDSEGHWAIEKYIKEKIKNTIKEYFEINKKYKGINTELQKAIFQYRQSWSAK